MSEVRRKSKMAALTGSRYKKRYISASIQDSDEIPTAIPTFSGLGNKMGLVATLRDVRGKV